MPRRMFGKSAPAATDFKDMHALGQLQLLGEVIIFACLCGGQVLRRIGPVRIGKQCR